MMRVNLVNAIGSFELRVIILERTLTGTNLTDQIWHIGTHEAHAII